MVRPCVLTCAATLRTETLLCLQPRTSWCLFRPSTHFPLQFCSCQATFAQGAAESVRKIRKISFNLFSALPPAARSAANCRPPSFIPRLASAIASRARRSKPLVIFYILYHIISSSFKRASAEEYLHKNCEKATLFAPDFWFAIIPIQTVLAPAFCKRLLCSRRGRQLRRAVS